MTAQLADHRPALVAFAAAKALAVGALLAGIWLNFTPLHYWNYLVYNDQEAGTLLAFINWDGQHFLRLAIGGYPRPADPSTVFYPLLPALIAAAMWLGLTPIAAGLLVATLSSLAAFLMLGRLLPREERGPSSLWLLACYPTAFYLSVVYAEALFLAALFGLLWALRDARRAPWALACAAALPLTRGQGLWLAAPLAAAWLALALRRGDPGARASLAAATLGYGLGAAAYFGFFWWHYGDPLAGLRAQQLFVSQHSIANLFDLPRFVELLLAPPRRFLDLHFSGLDKLMLIVSLLALLAGAARARRDPFLLVAWACFAVLPAMMGDGTAYARYSLIAWACFVPAVGPTLGRAAKWAIIVPGFALQAWLAFHFGGNRWVG